MTRRLIAAVGVALLSAMLAATSAQARPHQVKHHHHHAARSHAPAMSAMTDAMTPTERADYYSRGGQYVSSTKGQGGVRGYSISTTGEGRPAQCRVYARGRLIPWCGCWARLRAGISDPAFNLVRKWLTLRHVAGRGARPVIGAYAVMPGHVGVVTGIDANGNPIILSGNHNHSVGEGVYPRRRITAYVQP